MINFQGAKVVKMVQRCKGITAQGKRMKGRNGEEVKR